MTNTLTKPVKTAVTQRSHYWAWSGLTETWWACTKCQAHVLIPEQGCDHCNGRTWRSKASYTKSGGTLLVGDEVTNKEG